MPGLFMFSLSPASYIPVRGEPIAQILVNTVTAEVPYKPATGRRGLTKRREERGVFLALLSQFGDNLPLHH